MSGADERHLVVLAEVPCFRVVSHQDGDTTLEADLVATVAAGRFHYAKTVRFAMDDAALVKLRRILNSMELEDDDDAKPDLVETIEAGDSAAVPAWRSKLRTDRERVVAFNQAHGIGTFVTIQAGDERHETVTLGCAVLDVDGHAIVQTKGTAMGRPTYLAQVRLSVGGETDVD